MEARKGDSELCSSLRSKLAYVTSALKHAGASSVISSTVQGGHDNHGYLLPTLG